MSRQLNHSSAPRASRAEVVELNAALVRFSGVSKQPKATGAQLNARGLLFRVWAPDANDVQVEIDARGPERVALCKQSDGYFETELKGPGAGTLYRYYVDGK